MLCVICGSSNKRKGVRYKTCPSIKCKKAHKKRRNKGGNRPEGGVLREADIQPEQKDHVDLNEKYTANLQPQRGDKYPVVIRHLKAQELKRTESVITADNLEPLDIIDNLEPLDIIDNIDTLEPLEPLNTKLTSENLKLKVLLKEKEELINYLRQGNIDRERTITERNTKNHNDMEALIRRIEELKHTGTEQLKYIGQINEEHKKLIQTNKDNKTIKKEFIITTIRSVYNDLLEHHLRIVINNTLFLCGKD